VAELVLMVNSELVVGCLEFDTGSGQVRFRTGVSIATAELTESVIDRAVRGNVLTLDRYLPALVGPPPVCRRHRRSPTRSGAGRPRRAERANAALDLLARSVDVHP
jgi:hypothetical protein